ncbi:sulfotransferase [Chondrinema litorale]|uniref:sulfotransferase n=1 Tax=Chondrinema litorale TaxID=2994555 RepID=UPI0025430350|nr:sulfotransferase [Chondrinema litorale]UZS00182.1 sulfotransferase [Chondrinema litorale]
MKQKIVYIMGIGHSGSTFLQMLLSSHEQIVGMGEVSLLLKNRNKESIPQCSCGDSVENCKVWGGLLNELKNSDDDIQAFQNILLQFQEKFPSKILIDSSKNLISFKKYYANKSLKDIEVNVIFLVRDFRSWVISREKNNKRKSRNNYGVVYNAYKWYYRNRRKLNYLKSAGIPFTVISYEDLVLQKAKTLKKISSFLDIPNDYSEIHQAEMHDIYGNRMKNDTSKNKQIYYDNSWMKMNQTAFISPLLMLPYALNKKLYTQ